MTPNRFGSSKIPLLVLAITAIAGSRALFFFFKDPEGPNLLIVSVAAVIVYIASVAAYTFGHSDDRLKKFWFAIFVQILLLTGFYILGVRF